MVFNKKGFTLIEILIAVVILAFMATMTGVSISRSFKIKTKLEKEIDDDSQLREVIALITRDINLAFHWTDPQEILRQQIVSESVTQGKPNPYPPTISQDVIPANRLTAFVGETSSIYFSTLSNERQLKDSPESDQAKVGYYLKDVRSVKDKNMTKALVRRVSPYLDNDITQGGKETVLIENVKLLKFRYLPDDVKEITDSSWVDSWKTYDTLDPKMRDKFPAAVEIHLEIEKDKKIKKIDTIAAIHTTGNTPFQFSTATQPAQPPASPAKPPAAGPQVPGVPPVAPPTGGGR